MLTAVLKVMRKKLSRTPSSRILNIKIQRRRATTAVLRGIILLDVDAFLP